MLSVEEAIGVPFPLISGQAKNSPSPSRVAANAKTVEIRQRLSL